MDEQVARFHADVLAVLGRPPDGPIALAVSGGPDSMAMLALAHRAFTGIVIAATVDHRTRPAAADEAETVARYCAVVGVPHATLTAAEPLTGSALQARARALRYDLLERWVLRERAACLLTAHHADDQAETFLMRAARGTGPAGLTGIRARRAVTVTDWEKGWPKGGVVGVAREWDLTVIRPLLGWRRAELRVVVDTLALPCVDDPSNADDRFERTRVRRLLADHPWLDAAGLARAAAHAGEAQDALEATARWLWRTREVTPPETVEDPDEEAWIDTRDLPRELKRRIAREAIRSVRDITGTTRPAFDAGSNIEALLDALEAGGKATQAGVLASVEGDVWRFREAPPRRG